MIKPTLFLALLGLIVASVFAADTPTAARAVPYYPPHRPRCPCRCILGYYAEQRATRMCKRRRFLYSCSVQDCTKHYRPGKTCCDVHKPSVTPTPTPSVTPTPSPKPKCPCVCTRKGAARRDCHYKPYCEVTRCPEDHSNDHHTNPYGQYYKPRPKFQCCYKPHY